MLHPAHEPENKFSFLAAGPGCVMETAGHRGQSYAPGRGQTRSYYYSACRAAGRARSTGRGGGRRASLQ